MTVYGAYFYLILKLADLLDTVNINKSYYYFNNVSIVTIFQKGIFCAAQADQSRLVPSRISSFHNGNDRLWRYSIYTWRSGNNAGDH